MTGWGLFWSHRIPREPSAQKKKEEKKGGLEDKLRTKEFVCAKKAEGVLKSQIHSPIPPSPLQSPTHPHPTKIISNLLGAPR